MDGLAKIQKLEYWLIGLATALIVLHLTYLERANEPNLMSLSCLLWLGIITSIWDRRDKLKLESDAFSTLLGIALIVIVLLRSFSPVGYHIRISPIISGLGLCLMASGVQRLNQYWREISLLSFLALYPAFTGFLQAIDLSTLTAKFSAMTLWMAGFNAHRDGIKILLPTGQVEVYGACSGVDSIILMFCIAVLFLLLMPLKKSQQIICLSIAILVGFVVNGLRVSVLAVLVAFSHAEAFEYWHGGDGSFIFSMISVFLFGIFCWLAYVRNLTLDSGKS